MRNLIGSLSLFGVVARGGPDAAVLLGGEDADADSLVSEPSSSSRAATWMPVTG